MGWLLLGKSAGSKKGRRRAKEREVDPAARKRALLIAAAIFAVSALVVGSWIIGKRRLMEYTGSHSAVAFTPQDVQLADAPVWMSLGVQYEIQNEVAMQLSSNPLDEQGMDRLLAALSRNPWVAQVERIERHGGMIHHGGRRHLRSRIVLHAIYRKPMAVVQESTGSNNYHWVDGQGVRLPVTCKGIKEVEICGLPLIVNVSSEPGLTGEIWPGKDLEAGLALVGLLGKTPYMNQAEAIDVGARDSQDRVHLFLPTDKPDNVKWRGGGGSDSQTRYAMRQSLRKNGRSGVIWGLAPGLEESIDPPASDKLVRLHSVQLQKGTIDARGRVVDISGATALVLNSTFADRR